ncbi:uncharacterized protein LOC133668605 isoform X2 [Populus nigra]|uniref:uncharacterized protein LOC133668605 isoform X2 n=1 Tax=Populus nigra TaxID=3691 RepID=UPI002B275143|nr:uncharacterized protein LOC133668605 isoform X2 [Populus nigra]
MGLFIKGILSLTLKKRRRKKHRNCISSGGSKMAGNLGKEDPSSVQDVQDPSITGSGHKRPRGSVQPSSSRAGKKTKREIDRDYRERKKEEDEKLKAEIEKLKAEIEKLKASNFHLEGQTFQLRMDQKDTKEEMKKISEENFNLKIVQKSQSGSILELGKKLIASGEKIHALKEQHAPLNAELALHRKVCTLLDIDVGKLLWNAGEMNNPMETPATAQATTNCFNSDHFASQMA